MKTPLTISLDTEHAGFLKAWARERGRSVSDVAREGLGLVVGFPDELGGDDSPPASKVKRAATKRTSSPKSSEIVKNDEDAEQASDDQAASGKNPATEGVPGASGEPGPVPAEHSSKLSAEEDDVLANLGAAPIDVSILARQLEMGLVAVGVAIESLKERGYPLVFERRGESWVCFTTGDGE